MKLRILVHPSVLDRLRKSDEGILIELEEKYGAHLTFVSDAHLHVEDYTIQSSENGHVYYTTIEQKRDDQQEKERRGRKR